jgi:hypothetical protein
MPGNMQEAALACGCCGACNGCCLPVEFSETYPLGRALNIPFCISAPDCAELDGDCAEFVNASPTSPAIFGPCGICAEFSGSKSWSLLAFRWTEPPPGSGGECQMTPCTVTICLTLRCLDEESAPDIEDCCSRLRLIIGSSEEQADGSPGPSTGSCTSFKTVSPSFCECSGDPGAAPAVIFPLSLNFACQDLWIGGSCDGKIKCCQNLINCSLNNAEVVI